MVGIHKKVKQLLNIIQNYAPLLSKFVPGLGETVGMLREVGSSVKKLTQDYRGLHPRVKLKESYESEDE
jgi:hypothetical protein